MDHQEEEDQEGQLDLLERQVSLDKMVRMASQVLKAYKESLDPWEPLETKDQWENKDNKVILELQDHRDLEVILEKMVFLETMDHQVLRVLQETEEHLEVQDQEDSKVCQVHQARMVWLVKMVMQVSRDLLV